MKIHLPLNPSDDAEMRFNRGGSPQDNPYNPHTQPDQFDEWSIVFMECEYELAEVA